MVALRLLLLVLSTAGCSQAVLTPEPDYPGVRVALIPTFTPLPPATETLTPLPSATPTTPHYTPTPDPFERAGPPVRLEIPAIGVDSAVEQVGLLPNGAMDVPRDADNVAWFTENPIPGQAGEAAIIAGHLDSPFGPAVFYRLRMLVPGDELAITYRNGDRHVFVVESKERYVYDQAPVEKIFGPNPRRTLNLITCDGAWDRGAANYQQRLVVYTRLMEG